MKTQFSKPFLLAAAAAALCALPACSNDADQAAIEEGVTQEQTTRTMVSVLEGYDELGTFTSAIEQTGLASVFDNQGNYTLLAPSDAAFEALGDDAAALMSEEQRPLLIALLREHILPGQLTPEDIEAAIEAQEGEVSMTTLSGSTVTFTLDGDMLAVSNGQGATGSGTGSATVASNGVVIPINSVLLPAQPTEE